MSQAREAKYKMILLIYKTKAVEFRCAGMLFKCCTSDVSERITTVSDCIYVSLHKIERILFPLLPQEPMTRQFTRGRLGEPTTTATTATMLLNRHSVQPVSNDL